MEPCKPRRGLLAFTGFRADGSRMLCDCAGPLQLSGGLDYERSFDIRRNRRSTGGRPVAAVDTLLVDLDEIVTALGAFAQLQWTPVAPLSVSTGIRYDQLTFEVRDHFLADGVDNSATRPMNSPSWHIGAIYVVNGVFTPYATFSTSFETPTRNDGVEIGIAARAAEWLDLSAAWTLSSYTFTGYRVPNGAVTDTLDGKTQAGVPDHFVRMGVRVHWLGAALDVDHTLSSAMWADDKNTQRIDEWGSGVMNVRASWGGDAGSLHLLPFVAVNNLTDEAYVGAVTLNGAGGRTIEPAPLRNFYFGMEIGWRAVKSR